ncbi:MAG: hypothetical protein H0T42_29145 [Deltaproteobacteria bacterium]|nr:hypothetical protein [Deltaproteobacteria bacterium]
MVGRFGAALAILLGGCSLVTDSFLTNDFSGDPYPIQAELQSGAVVLGLRQAGVPDRTTVLDLLSPITLVDPGPGIAPSVSNADLLLLGQNGAGGPIDLPRASLDDVQMLALHPCNEDGCSVGTPAAPRPYDAILGADALAGDAIRLRLGDEQVFVLADIGGDEAHRTRACDGVFPSPYRGGGTLLIAGTELPFMGRRVALQTCLGANPDPVLPQSRRGSDALLVLSTSIGITILGESAYLRYLEAQPTAPALESLPMDTAYLPSGPIEGRLGSIANLALVASSSSSPRAPCRQVYGSHLMIARDCVAEDDCPCEDRSTFCGVPAIVELEPPGGHAVLIVPDSNPTLQALRTELRPDQAEVDGILGTNALLSSEIDVDYPHNRLLARCTADGCRTRPSVTEARERTQAQNCLGPSPVGPIF